MPKFALGLLFSTCLFAQYNDVYLVVSAPKDWQKQITDTLTNKLNAIPDVQVVDKAEDAAFTISVDVNAVRRGREDDIIGYSIMALIYGTYDRTILTAMFDALWKDSKDKSVLKMLDFLKYTASGNIFLAGTVHTHGPLSDIDEAYDLVVAKLKSDALPEFRRFKKMVEDIPDNVSKKTQSTGRF